MMECRVLLNCKGSRVEQEYEPKGDGGDAGRAASRHFTSFRGEHSALTDAARRRAPAGAQQSPIQHPPYYVLT